MISKIIEKIFKFSKKNICLITRCKDEFFIEEFVDYYLSEQIDHIYIIDDNSADKSIYENILNNNSVTILFEKNIIKRNLTSKIYKSIRKKYEWCIFVDVDEFIAPKKVPQYTIKEQICKYFSDVDCIKVPWVMMSSNGRVKNPNRLLVDTVFRWDHDKQHPHEVHKFRCRYHEIESKCIFRTSKFRNLSDHHPTEPVGKVNIVESIHKNESDLSPFCKNLREKDIESGLLACYHYRIISKENNIKKLSSNIWYNTFTQNDLERSDYSEKFDNSLSIRNFRDKIFIIGFNRVGTRSIHYFFKNQGIPAIHWDDDNLAKCMMSNQRKGKKLLSNGRTKNIKVNSNLEYCNCQVFSDITFHEENIDAKDFYKQLDKDYPNSFFILNVRKKEDWIKSRKSHMNGYIFRILKGYHRVNEEELETIFSDLWDETIDEMKKYFSGREKFMIFDIDKHTGHDIVNFFRPYCILNADEYNHIK